MSTVLTLVGGSVKSPLLTSGRTLWSGAMRAAMAVAVLVISAAASAEEMEVRAVPGTEVAAPANFLSVDAAGLAGFGWVYAGDFALQYERVFGGVHGLVIRGTFAHVHGDPNHLSLFGGD